MYATFIDTHFVCTYILHEWPKLQKIVISILVCICFQMWMIVTLHLVKMVVPVWMNMGVTHVSALISGLVSTVQVCHILILAGYTYNLWDEHGSYTCQCTEQWFGINCTCMNNNILIYFPSNSCISLSFSIALPLTIMYCNQKGVNQWDPVTCPPRWSIHQSVVITGRAQIIRSHSSARFCSELSGNCLKWKFELNNTCWFFSSIFVFLPKREIRNYFGFQFWILWILLCQMTISKQRVSLKWCQNPMIIVTLPSQVNKLAHMPLSTPLGWSSLEWLNKLQEPHLNAFKFKW